MTGNIPYWTRLIPPGELPPRAVLVRLVLALVLSISLWVFVTHTNDPVVFKQYDGIAVTVDNPTGYYPVQQPAPVSVTLEGLNSTLHDAAPPQAFVDLRKFSPTATGSFAVQVTNLPGDVNVTKIDPPSVNLRLERVARKTVAVVVQPLNAPLGYDVSQPVVSPVSVTLTGPSGTIKGITQVGATLDESTFRNDTTVQLEPTIYDSSGKPVSRRIVRIDPGTVHVHVSVRLKQYVGVVPVLPIITGTVAAGYRLSAVTPISPVVEVISNVPIPVSTTIQTAPISVRGWSTGRSVLVRLDPPPGLTLRRAIQETVAINLAPVPGSAVTTAGILLLNQRAGTTVTLDPPKVTVSYEGPIPILNSAIGTPHAVLDIQNRQPGVYYMHPSINLAPGLSLLLVTPPQIRVVITAPPVSTATRSTGRGARAQIKASATVIASATPTVRATATARAQTTIRSQLISPLVTVTR